MHYGQSTIRLLSLPTIATYVGSTTLSFNSRVLRAATHKISGSQIRSNPDRAVKRMDPTI